MTFHMKLNWSKIDGFIKIYDGTRYLKMIGPEKYDAIYNRTLYLKSKKWHHIYFSLFILQKSKLILMILCL